MLAAPRRRETLPKWIRDKVWACLATRFNVEKRVIQSVLKLDEEIIQYGKVYRLQGGDRMTGSHFVKNSEDGRDASFVRVESFLLSKDAISEYSLLQYTLYVDRHARHRRKTPDFVEKIFFGQLNRILVLELPPAPRLNLAEPTTLVLALIHEAKVTLRNGIYYYKDLGAQEVVDMNTVQCVVGRVWDRSEWAIVDRSDCITIQVD
jgi:hypothetical protein